MTCIVALKDLETRTVFLGGDSRRSMDGGLSIQLPVEACKVFDFSGFVIGHTGAVKIRNITSQVDIKFTESGPTKEFDLETTLLKVLIPEFKSIAKKGGYLLEKEGISFIGGQILVAFGNQICIIHDDFSVTPVAGPFWAVGSGQRLALGSLATSEGLFPPKERVRTALEVASQFEQSVAPPFVIKQTKPIPLG
jgi:hypothetical protein